MLERLTAFSSFHPPAATATRQEGAFHRRRHSFCTAIHNKPSSLVSLSSHTPLQQISFEAASVMFLSSDMLATTAPATTATTFEPVLNVPALGSFVLIMTLFLLLRLRVGAISDAADTRMAALEALREVKRNELNSEATTREVEAAVQAYQTALEREEALRTLVPGVRLRAPNNPQRSEGDRQAVRQFLPNSSDPTEKNSLLESLDDSSSQDPPSQLPTLALTTLLVFVFGSQILLFLFLSMDDTTANQVLTELSTAATSGTSNGGGVAEAVGDLMSLE